MQARLKVTAVVDIFIWLTGSQLPADPPPADPTLSKCVGTPRHMRLRPIPQAGQKKKKYIFVLLYLLTLKFF